MSALARQCLPFSDFTVLAVKAHPFPAKRNGGGYGVFSGIIDLRERARAVINERFTTVPSSAKKMYICRFV